MIEQVTRRPPFPADSGHRSWWDQYSDSLAGSALSSAAREVIEADCTYVTGRCVFGVGAPGSDGWPAGRVRRGLVMGAVQSGKTASMLGVAAKSLDEGTDLIIVLAGTRIALWRQTFQRLLEQLDRYDADRAPELARRRVLLPDPALALVEETGSTPAQLYSLNRPRARRAIAAGRPIVAVVMKHPQHLRAMAGVLRESVLPHVDAGAEPFHMMVLDDESDDGSILDAAAERSRDASLHHLKTVPRAIVDLWAARPNVDETASANLYATYIGYTATPQANFLQADHNPLAPRDFVAALRTPFDRGEIEPRTATYREPSGLSSYYTGGETYYRRLRGSSVVQASTAPMLGPALRAFLIASAIRIWEDPGRLSLQQARSTRFESRDDARRRSPLPRSMLFHPSAVVADQFEGAANLLEEGCGLDARSSRARVDAGDRSLPVEAIRGALEADEQLWAQWLDEFRSTAIAVQRAFDLPTAPRVPPLDAWPEIRRLLLDDIAPSTTMKVVNSDPMADDRPQFDPIPEADGTWSAAPDLNTIFVSGNVMSRGLTLEGLTTTVFDRRSADPFADTQMQMQRWFGYRGRYLHLCRLFLPPDQLELFEAYHDTDESVRASVAAAMAESDDAPMPYVLAGRDFSATGKLTNIDNVPLCPGGSPFVRLVNADGQEDPNLEVLADAFVSRPSTDIVVKGILRGRILEHPVTLLQAADLLDQLRYREHRPTRDGWEGHRWIDLESKVGIDAATDIDGALPFFRPPELPPGEASHYARGGPYAISAYLRLWQACLTRRALGLVPTDDPSSPWSMADLATKQSEEPAFYVGVRYGSGAPVTSPDVAKLTFQIRSMKRAVVDGALAASWGSRNPRSGPDQYLGDELFDYHLHGGTPPTAPPGEPLWRPPGSPGLILFHVIEHPDSLYPMVAFGAALPLGGPDQFAARDASLFSS
jgi:hypothetical protein